MTKTNIKKKETATKKSLPAWVWIVLASFLGGVIYFTLTSQQTVGVEKLAAEVSVDKAKQLRDQGAFILDVREQTEWDQFHIPDATLIPLGTLPDELANVPKDKPVVVVCRTGRRSAEGRDILLKAGYQNVTSMAGGVTEWQAKGLPIESGN